jgi:hypothetical protein
MRQIDGKQMGKTTRPSAARLKEILRRQDPPAWGKDYIPAIRATREEAPSRSRPSQIWCEQIQRHVHALSDPEKFACLMAMFHPWLFELQEQRMLHYLQSAHPLDSHARGAGVIRPPLRGTLEIADAFGLLHFHAMVPAPVMHVGEIPSMMPFPWTGDVLLFLDDGHGPYCVNWTTKDREEDFELGASLGRPPKSPEQKAAQEKARHTIEAVYYLDGKIPTVRIVRANLDQDLVANLGQIVLWTGRKHAFAEAEVQNIVNYFKAAVGTSTPAMNLVFELARAHDCEIDEIKKVLHQAIWRRQIRIDLFQPFHIDKPLLRERQDPLEVYAHLFARS